MDNEVVFDLTGVEESDWLKRSPAGLVDLSLSLPSGTDLRAYLVEHPGTPLAKAVFNGELVIPDDLPVSSIGDTPQRNRELLERLQPDA